MCSGIGQCREIRSMVGCPQSEALAVTPNTSIERPDLRHVAFKCCFHIRRTHITQAMSDNSDPGSFFSTMTVVRRRSCRFGPSCAWSSAPLVSVWPHLAHGHPPFAARFASSSLTISARISSSGTCCRSGSDNASRANWALHVSRLTPGFSSMKR
jgi:hypothetical protein